MASALFSGLSMKKHEIRLVQLQPASSFDCPLVGTLIKVSLLQKPEYMALSYMCGDVSDLRPMTLSGAPVSIYRNLDRALRHVRSVEATLTLWIDQLCINQKDLIERSQQVRFMGVVYSSAEQVLVHIDYQPDPKESTDDFDVLAMAQKNLATMITLISTTRQLERDEHWTGPDILKEATFAVRHLFGSPYWLRIWCLQELILARTAIFYLETRAVSYTDVETFYEWYRRHMGDRKCCQPVTIEGVRGLDDTAIAMVNRSFGLTLKKRALRKQSEELELLDLLASFRFKKATVLQDKIFALAGLAHVPSSILDYTLGPVVCYEKVAVYLIESMSTLDVLNNVISTDLQTSLLIQTDSTNSSGPAAGTPVLPSWAPDWSAEIPLSTGNAFNERLELLNLYNASESVPAIASYSVNGQLRVLGTRCGSIARLGHCWEKPWNMSAHDFEKWQAFAGSTIGDYVSAEDLGENRQHFIAAMSGGLGVASDGSFYLLRTKEDHLRNEFLCLVWWNMVVLGKKEFAPRCHKEVAPVFTDFYDSSLLRFLMSRYNHLVERNCMHKRLAVLVDGTFAFVPNVAIEGDIVCLLRGGKTPFVLGKGRRVLGRMNGRSTYVHVDEQTQEEKADYWQLVGDAYASGLMDGSRFLEMIEKEEEEFVLV